MKDRAVIVKTLKALPVEAVVRGYLAGSGWKEYRRDGSVCGIDLPRRLQLADKLPAPIFTPSTKAAVGNHDTNVRFADVANSVGSEVATQIRDVSVQLYRQAADYALKRGIIIADTKFEFGLDQNERLTLIDEVLTPDSSRFWPAETYRPGISPPSFDKQFVRDYLETLDWDKAAPGPELPQEIVLKTAQKYRQAQQLLLE
jgi:phosphoribosylaminoimidazole-succinocarboxamide synthase